MGTEPDQMTLERVESLAERAYRALREQIATGGLAPGERVTERGLAVRLGVSSTPVREALHRLEQDCLVERVTARQLRIAEQPVESLRELMYVEAAIRAAAARFATAKITAETLDEMGEVVDELERNPEQGDPEHQLSLARRFDELLLGAAGNDLLTGLIAPISVFGWALRVKAVRAMHADPEFGWSRIRAHRELLTALRARDADRVETLTRLQLDAASDYLMEWAQ
ncbi:MAG: GntR family transcriptional regulator [Amycolatopsis sp.]|uniref:GntR family transcriptional regulator n=1 Tax=Amycolatopsis sp. TaxID=37632 RepID=UPI00262EE071|nr:GntR family transcriptional regulator [Amycolatopsis sp.]MCU1679812.1 GntR family transcriptional regulator [Amycolatopsis sp.]